MLATRHVRPAPCVPSATLPGYAPERLTGLDTSFLALEEGGAHMHVGSCLVFEGDAPGYREFVAQLERRLHLVPRYRQKLAFPPLRLARPVWVDDPHFSARWCPSPFARTSSAGPLLSQAARLQARQRFFNLTVTNVPGPQFPLYLLGRRLRELYPLVPLTENTALGIAVMSYDGSVDFGLVSDYDALPDLDALAAALGDAILELADAAGVGDEVARANGRTPAPPGEGAVVAFRRRAVGHDGGHARSRFPRCASRSRRSTPASATSRATRASSATASRAARDAGAELVLFPELALTGYPPEDLLLKEHFLQAAQEALADSRREAEGIVALVGFPERTEDVYNALAVLANGRGAQPSTARCGCRTTACSTSSATSRPATRRWSSTSAARASG